MGFGFRGGDLGYGEESGVWGERLMRLNISSSCMSNGDLLIRHLTVASSCGVMEVSFIFLIMSCEKYLYQKSGKGWRMKEPGRVV